MILILILYMLLASTFTIGKAALDYAQPIFFIGMRMTIAGMILLGYLYFFNRREWKFLKKDIISFIYIATFHIYVSYILEFWALQYVASAKACFLYNLSPFITVLFSYFMFSEKMNLRKWLGLLVGFFGFLPVLMLDGQGEYSVGSFFFLSLPELCLLISAISAVIGWVVMKKLVSSELYSPIMVNGIGMLWGGLAALITSFIIEGKPALKFPSGCTKISLGSILPETDFFCSYAGGVLLFVIYTALLILIANVIFYNLYGFLLKKYTATFLAFVGFTCPLFAALFGWFFRGESVSWPFFLSVFFVFCGLYIFYREEQSDLA